MSRLIYILLIISALSCDKEGEPKRIEEVVKLLKLTVIHKDYNNENSYEFEYDLRGRLRVINRFSKGKLGFIETYFYEGMDKYPLKKEQIYIDRFIETTSDGTQIVVEKCANR